MEFSNDDDHVILVCTDPDPIEGANKEILVSTTDILVWDSPEILSFHTIKVQAHRNRLIEQSSYFRGLLTGSFSESCSGAITIKWNVPAFMKILKHMYGGSMDIAMDNFLPLYKGAIYFGVDTLLLKCETWFSDVLSPKGGMAQKDYSTPTSKGRTILGGYNTPTSNDFRGSIVTPPIHASSFQIKPALISLVQQNQFGGEAIEDPGSHLETFLSICDTFKIDGASDDAIRLRLFPFSLRGSAKRWLYAQRQGSIYTWDDLISRFVWKYLPPSKRVKMRREIETFVHQDNESLLDAWERYNELLRRCPRHSLPEWDQIETFYYGLVPSTQVNLDCASGGSLSLKTPEDALEIIENLAVRSTNHLRDRQSQSQREGLEVETFDSILAQNKVLLRQVASLTQQLSSIQAKAVATPTLECDFCKDLHENGNCQANPQEEQVNILGQQNSFNQGCKNQSNISQCPQGSEGNSSFQDQGQSFNDSGSKLPSLEDALKKLTVKFDTFMEETRANFENQEVYLKNLEYQVG